MAHGIKLQRRGASAQLFQLDIQRTRRGGGDGAGQSRDRNLGIGLAERNQSRSRRHQIGRDDLDIGLQGR